MVMQYAGQPDSGRPKAIFLLGPTCSGKTALSISLAQHWPMEIISVDSALVYKGMDIGTAKPDERERAGIAHHLIDIRDPADAYSVAEFVDDASALMAQITQRDRIPLLVGGTMLYARALLGGLATLPAADPELRARIMALAQAKGWGAVHQALAVLDPETAQRLHPNDTQRLQRALEVCWQSGKPFSSFLQTQSRMASPLGSPQGRGFSYQPLIFGLMPQDRASLHDKIAVRFKAMLESGFLEEVQALYARKTLHAELPSVRCVGYRQAWQFLSGEYDYNTFVDRSLAATRQLAKRQLTWLRGWSGLTVVDCDGKLPDLEVRLKRSVEEFLENPPGV